MKMMCDFRLPVEPFNSYVKDGTAGEKIQKVLEAIKPEAVYFAARDGERGGILIVDVENGSQFPRIAEPLFLSFNAKVSFHGVVTPEDLASAGLEELGKQFA